MGQGRRQEMDGETIRVVVDLIDQGDFQSAVETFKKSPIFNTMGLPEPSNITCGRVLEGRLLYFSLHEYPSDGRYLIAAHHLQHWLDQLEHVHVENELSMRMNYLKESIKLSAHYMAHVTCEACTDIKKEQQFIDMTNPLNCNCRCKKVAPILDRIRVWQTELSVLIHEDT